MANAKPNRERKIEDFIDRLEGFERRVMIDTYRHLVFAHMVGREGRRAEARLNRDYPQEGVFEPILTPDGRYASAHNRQSASDMLLSEIRNNDGLTTSVRETLESLLTRLVDERILEPPRTHRSIRERASSVATARAVVPAVKLVPYRRARSETAPESTPYVIDPVDRDEKTRQHMQLQNEFAEFLLRNGIEPRSTQGIDVDIAWREKRRGTIVLGEVKTLNAVNETRQMRLGLGQLLDYLASLNGQTTARGVLIVERKPADGRWIALLERQGIALVWPRTFGRALRHRLHVE